MNALRTPTTIVPMYCRPSLVVVPVGVVDEVVVVVVVVGNDVVGSGGGLSGGSPPNIHGW
jgi:hypothetical protein